MIGGATASLADTGTSRIETKPLGKGNGAGRGRAAAAYASLTIESLHVESASKDGDVLEVDWEHREEVFAGVAFAETGAEGPEGPDGPGHGPGKKAGAEKLAGANAEAAEPAGSASEADGGDARLERLARLRDWASRVADEVRKQQKRILEENLKRSGSFVPGGEGRYIVIYAEQGAPAQDEGGEEGEKGVPEYWNAENTSDRIVKFATQMAEIAGDDSGFAETIMKAVADGFDQANAATGPLPGAAGELNRKTRELTFSKLSKWLEERKAGGYNQGARTEDIQTLVDPHGTQNHEQ
jgi:hypothetical protein